MIRRFVGWVEQSRAPVWVLGSTAYLFLLVELFVVGREGGIWGVVAGSALVTAAGAPTALRLKRDVLDAPALYALATIVTFGLMSLAWIGSPLDRAPGINRDDVAEALPLVAGALLTFGLGARLLGSARPRPALRILGKAAPHPGVLVALIALSSLGTVAGIALGRIGFGASEEGLSSAASQPLYQMLTVGNLAVLAAALTTFGQRWQWRRQRLFVFALAGVQVAVGFVFGLKALSLIPLVLVLLAYMVTANRIPWGRFAVVTVVILALLLPANALYRQYLRPNPAAPDQTLPELMADQAKKYLLFRFRLIDHVALIRENTPSPIPYGNGSRYLYLPAIVLIPRAVWSDKPVLREDEFSSTYWQIPGVYRTSQPLTQVGDLYRNFGNAGVGVGMLAWGLVIGGFCLVCRRWRSARTEMIYLFSLVTWVTVVESDLPNQIAGALKSMVVAVAVAWLVMPGRRGEPGYRWIASRLGPLAPSRSEDVGSEQGLSRRLRPKVGATEQ